MKIKRVLLVVAMCGACVFGSVGCGTLALPSALAKLAAGNVGDLTPEEILALSQVAADFINSQEPGAAVELTPEQAAAIATFLDQNNVTTLDELEALFMEAEANPDAGPPGPPTTSIPTALPTRISRKSSNSSSRATPDDSAPDLVFHAAHSATRRVGRFRVGAGLNGRAVGSRISFRNRSARMFSGIIDQVGEIVALDVVPGGCTLGIRAPGYWRG